MIIEKIDKELEILVQKASVLQYKRMVAEQMLKLVQSISPDDRQALYEILEEESINGNLGWSR